MLNRRELCDLSNPDEAELLIDVAGKSLQNSEWTLTGGLPSKHYFDLDSFLCDNAAAVLLIDMLVKKIKLMHTRLNFNKIAFIDKGENGPVGLITFMGFIAKSVEIETIIVRPKKMLIRSFIKGTLVNNDRVLVLSDVATSGHTIFQAAQKLWGLHAKVPYALVVFDRAQGATLNLGRKGIELYSLISAESLHKDEKARERIAKTHNMAITNDFEQKLVDFAGTSAIKVGSE